MTMVPEELRAIMGYLRQRVHLENSSPDAAVVIGFDPPTVDEMTQAGFNPAGCQQILDAAWWDEMAADIVETPDMCDPEDPPEQVLEYARDVVSEYIRKRVQL